MKKSTGAIKIQTDNLSQTRKVGRLLAEEILKEPLSKEAVVLALEGDLGSGKTSFVQGLAKGLGVREKILSPTFVIVKRFKIKKARFENFYHIDCYRVKGKKELLSLGLKEILNDPKNIVAVEWSDRIKKILPSSSISLKFDLVKKDKRKIFLHHG